MKQRTRNILKAAEAGLEGYSQHNLFMFGEFALQLEIICKFPFSTEECCLFLCFCAAANETGDL